MKKAQEVDKSSSRLSLESLLISAQPILSEVMRDLRLPEQDREDIYQSCRLALIESYQRKSDVMTPTQIKRICLNTIYALHQQQISAWETQTRSRDIVKSIQTLMSQIQVQCSPIQDAKDIPSNEGDPQSRILIEEMRRVLSKILLGTSSKLSARQQQIIALILDSEIPPLAISHILKVSPKYIYEQLKEIWARYQQLSPTYHRAKMRREEQHKNIMALNQQYNIHLQPQTDEIFLIGRDKIHAAQLLIELAQAQYPGIKSLVIGSTKNWDIGVAPATKKTSIGNVEIEWRQMG